MTTSGISAMPAPPAGLGFGRDARSAGTGDGHAPGETGADGHGNRGDFVLGLHEGAAVFRQFATERFHDVRPRSDRISSAETHAGGDDAERHGFIAIHDDLVTILLLA